MPQEKRKPRKLQSELPLTKEGSTDAKVVEPPTTASLKPNSGLPSKKGGSTDTKTPTVTSKPETVVLHTESQASNDLSSLHKALAAQKDSLTQQSQKKSKKRKRGPVDLSKLTPEQLANRERQKKLQVEIN
jgi:hypothetical protein